MGMKVPSTQIINAYCLCCDMDSDGITKLSIIANGEPSFSFFESYR